MKITAIWRNAIWKLRSAKDADSQWDRLQACSTLQIHTPGTLKEYLDALLFLCVYPFSEKVFTRANSELERLVEVVKQHQHNQKWRYVLSGSGLPFTEMRCQYSIDLVQWLLDKFPGQVKPAESDEHGDGIPEIFRAALPGVEFHLSTNGNWNIWNRIKLLSGHYHNADALRWLLQLFVQQKWDPVLRDHLYDSLKIFISWHLSDNVFSRSFLRCPITSVYYHKKIDRGVNPLLVIRKPLKKTKTLKQEEKMNLISVIRSSLAFYQRETDPATYADPDETFLFDMGEGLQIALTGMKPERRLSIESYVGFMAFKNGVPIAYGGSWLFGYRCEIGVNVYSSFRGGESEKLFCQVMRLYYQRFKVKKFIVKPYQFGKDNPEGLKSAAFWFYYKLGFRHGEKRINEIAGKEWEKIKRNKKHRTSLKMLKYFATCNVEWEPVKSKIFYIDADEISKSVTKMINEKYKGDRSIAIRDCMRKLNSLLKKSKIQPGDTIGKKVWQNWSLIYCSLQNTTKWTPTQKEKFLWLIQLKAQENEKDFILALQQHEGFWGSLKNI